MNKAKPLFITATGTGVGKTHVACMLISALTKRGIRAAPFKPIETGVISLPEDAARLKAAAAIDLPLEIICPIRFALPAAPAVARGETPIDWAKMDAAFEACKAASDIALIEGAGGAFAPIDDRFFSVDLAKRYDAKTLLIAPDRLGMIHDLLTTLEAIEKRLGRAAQWIVNIQNAEAFDRVSAPYLTRKFGRFNRLDLDFETLTDTLIK
jgi:dethiobiotin synthetase